jgi:hypothetical protein
MKAGLVLIPMLALMGMGCSDATKGKAEAEAARAAQAKAEAELAGAKAETAKAEAELAAAKAAKGAPPVRFELVAPLQLAPEDRSILDQFPRKTTLRWAPVAGAAKYRVEIEYQEPGGNWLTHPAGRETGPTERELEFVGAQPGRWRVWAVDDSGREGPRSVWWTFRYTR